MHYAVMSFQTDFTMRPDEIAREVEARGFESLWFPDHSHIPASRRTPHQVLRCRQTASSKSVRYAADGPEPAPGNRPTALVRGWARD